MNYFSHPNYWRKSTWIGSINYSTVGDNMGISQDRMEKSLTYLADTDKQYGILKGMLEGLEHNLKIIEAQGIINHQGMGGVDLIKSLARTSDDYKHLVAKVEEMSIEFHTIAAKRNTEATVVEVWRSIESSRRAGNVK
jgi:hypothetical protein